MNLLLFILTLIVAFVVVRRGDVATPNPRADMAIAQGDRLLCFGKFDHIREVFRCDGESGVAPEDWKDAASTEDG